jgi:hypothetical protein
MTMAKVQRARRSRSTSSENIPEDPGVKRQIRLALFEKALDRLLLEPENRDFVIFELRGSPDAYVQYMLHDGAVLGEVGCKGWVAEGEPLDKERVTALGCLGFESGGYRANFARDQLPQEPRRLACLTELLFGAAYRPAPDFDVTVVTKSMSESDAAKRHAAEIDA